MTTGQERRTCYYCGHAELALPALETGLFAKLLCRSCRDGAVVKNCDAIIMGAKVVKWMIHNKQLFPSGGAAKALNHSKIRLSSVDDDMDWCEAFVVSKGQLKRSRRSQNESHHIIIRPGLPGWYLEAVLAHEFGHLYLDSLPGEMRLPNLLEEGFCQVLACQVHILV